MCCLCNAGTELLRMAVPPPKLFLDGMTIRKKIASLEKLSRSNGSLIQIYSKCNKKVCRSQKEAISWIVVGNFTF